MPVEKVSGGYRYGKSRKIYKKRIDAEKQGAAIRASQARRKKRRKR